MTDTIATKARAAAFHVEARKIAYRQSKDGVVISFLLHPQQVPDNLAVADLGQRYLLALVAIGDDEQPRGGEADRLETANGPHNAPPRQQDKPAGGVPKRRWDEMTPAQQAGILCADEDFQRFLRAHLNAAVLTEDEAAAFVRQWCEVESRRYIGAVTGNKSAQLWRTLVAEYRAWQNYPDMAPA